MPEVVLEHFGNKKIPAWTIWVGGVRGGLRTGTFYGQFTTKEAAQEALASNPEAYTGGIPLQADYKAWLEAHPSAA